MLIYKSKITNTNKRECFILVEVIFLLLLAINCLYIFEFVLFVLFCASINTEKIILKKLNGITLKIKTATPTLAIKNKGDIVCIGFAL